MLEIIAQKADYDQNGFISFREFLNLVSSVILFLYEVPVY